MKKKFILSSISSMVALSVLTTTEIHAQEKIDAVDTVQEKYVKEGVSLEEIFAKYHQVDVLPINEVINDKYRDIYLNYSGEAFVLFNDEGVKIESNEDLEYSIRVIEDKLEIILHFGTQNFEVIVPLSDFEEMKTSDSVGDSIPEEIILDEIIEDVFPKEDSTDLQPEDTLDEEVSLEEEIKENSSDEESPKNEQVPPLDNPGTEENAEETPISVNPPTDENNEIDLNQEEVTVLVPETVVEEKASVEENIEESSNTEEIPMEEKASPSDNVKELIKEPAFPVEPIIEEKAVAPRQMLMSKASKAAIPASGYYIVKSGDSLSRIANQFGVPLNKIIEWNKITNPNVIQVGQKIILEPTKYVDTRPFKSAEEFINYFATTMTRVADEKGLFPSVMIGQALHESGFGNSGLSRAPYYNLFGIKGSYNGNSVLMETWEDTSKGPIIVMAPFRDYGSYEESIYDYADLLLTGTYGNETRYSRTWTANSNNYIEAVYGLILDTTVSPVKGGYATDRDYADNVIRAIEQYQLFKYDSNGLNGWHVINGKQKFLKNDKYLTGLNKIGATTYLFDGSGAKQFGWKRLNGKDYYFNPGNGGMLTGLRKIGQTSYLFSSNGAKQYGWHRLNGKDYYFNMTNGGMVTGKRKIGNTTYLFNRNGVKQYGWYFDGKHKYYFNPTNGGLLSGLRIINGATYYFEHEKGNALTNTTRVISGVKWTFNSAGVGKK